MSGPYRGQAELIGPRARRIFRPEPFTRRKRAQIQMHLIILGRETVDAPLEHHRRIGAVHIDYPDRSDQLNASVRLQRQSHIALLHVDRLESPMNIDAARLRMIQWQTAPVVELRSRLQDQRVHIEHHDIARTAVVRV